MPVVLPGVEISQDQTGAMATLSSVLPPSISAEIKVLEGAAEVAQPTTVYTFTGQGSQEQGMGMDLYNSSPVRFGTLLIPT